MKNALLIITTILTLTAFAQEPTKNQILASADTKPHIKFETTTVDFGKIKKDVPVEKEFVFTNTGNSPLIISSARPSCSCTVPHSPTEAILPGKKESIKAGYSAHNMGQFTKTITVSSNAEESNVVLTIKGEVIE